MADLDSDEDEDEETLQLQLKEIQARLKLKKLQRKAKQSSDTENEHTRPGSAALSREESLAVSRSQSRLAGLREHRLERSKSQTAVHVPASPVRRVQNHDNQRSPSRVLLGIDKGLKGSDVTLRKAPSLKRNLEAEFQNERRTGPFLQRSRSQAGSRSNRASLQASDQDDRPKTFSERMAAIRAQDTAKQEKDARIRKNRSTAFNIDRQEMDDLKSTAVEFPDLPQGPKEFSRAEVLKATGKSDGGLSRSSTVPNLRLAVRDTSNGSSSTLVSNQSQSRATVDRPASQHGSKTSSSQPTTVSDTEPGQFEPFSKFHLSKRIIPHQTLTRTLSGKTTFLLPDLLPVVKSPDYQSPDIETDLVTFAIVAQKTEPRSHQPNTNNKNENKRGKYMLMTLTDLKWELELFLFDTAFDKFWKLTPGTVIAILNPGFMPPPKGKTDTGKFSLTLNSSDDTILEIGSARDLGFCKSVKKNGKVCESWVDKRHTEFCEFHINETLRKTKAGRMEVNGSALGGAGGVRRWNGGNTGERRKKEEEEKRLRYDKESHTQIYIGNRTTAGLLDDVDFDADPFHRGSTKDERLKRKLIAQERERELARKIGSQGSGLGADYMRRKGVSTPGAHAHPNSQQPSTAPPPPPDAKSLGLIAGKHRDTHLSPIKRKRLNPDSSTGTTAAVGWGKGLGKELGRLKDGERLQPVRKKTRFVTEKGIREAGRESFGGDTVLTRVGVAKGIDGGGKEEESDDGLDIVRE